MEFVKQNSYSLYTSYRVSLPNGGEALITPTDANHIHFDANHHSVNGRPGDRCWIVCRDIEYGASVHLNRVNGEWLLSPNARPFISRVSNSKDASPAAIKWIVNAALAVVQEFARQHPLVLAKAYTSQVSRDLEGKQTELLETRAKVAELEKSIAELTREQGLAITLELHAARACAVCGVAGPDHGHYDAHNPAMHKFVSR